MCGICGAIEMGVTGTGWESRLRAMADAIAHRGPDDQGLWFDQSTGIGLANCRLSIVDLSPLGHQPMTSASGRFVVVLNGEIYNHRAIRDELLTVGAQFRGHSDTEVFVAALEQWGLFEAIKRFVGMFAFAAWDVKDRTLHLGRDRMGEKPLYYGWIDNTLLFGSELKALRAHPGFNCEIDRDALALFVRYNCIPDPLSIYKGILKLPPGTVLTIPTSTGRMREASFLTQYWSVKHIAALDTGDQTVLTDAEAVDQLQRLLSASVAQQMVADVPLGVFLSGGIDSSTIASLMQAQSLMPVKSFTIGFNDAQYNEAKDAAHVAAHLGLDHTEALVTETEATDVIPLLPTMYDEPFADSSQIPTYLVSKLAREHVTVSLSGDGGDELFGGYNRHAWVNRISRAKHHLPQATHQLMAKGLTALSPQQWNHIFNVLSPIIPPRLRIRSIGDQTQKLAMVLAANDPASMYQSLVSHWTDPSTLVLGSREPDSIAMNEHTWPKLKDFTSLMMYLDMVNYLPNDILVKLDRASMAVSLESRAPLLDHRLVEFAWQLPMSMKIRNGQTKWALRQVLYRHVPRELIDRPKTGFGIPLGAWLRGPLRDWAEELLSEERLCAEGFFDPSPVREKWSEHVEGRQNWQHHLWDILMFQAWVQAQKQALQNEPARPLTI